jgi:hypothetical protein
MVLALSPHEGVAAAWEAMVSLIAVRALMFMYWMFAKKYVRVFNL